MNGALFQMLKVDMYDDRFYPINQSITLDRCNRHFKDDDCPASTEWEDIYCIVKSVYFRPLIFFSYMFVHCYCFLFSMFVFCFQFYVCRGFSLVVILRFNVRKWAFSKTYIFSVFFVFFFFSILFLSLDILGYLNLRPLFGGGIL